MIKRIVTKAKELEAIKKQNEEIKKQNLDMLNDYSAINDEASVNLRFKILMDNVPFKEVISYFRRSTP